MKNALLIVGLTLMLFSCQNSPSLVGTWQLDHVSCEELTDNEKETTMTFNEDGSYSQNGETVEGMTWELSEDGKTLTTKAEMFGETFENDMDIVEITDSEFTYTAEDCDVTWKKVD